MCTGQLQWHTRQAVIEMRSISIHPISDEFNLEVERSAGSSPLGQVCKASSWSVSRMLNEVVKFLTQSLNQVFSYDPGRLMNLLETSWWHTYMSNASAMDDHMICAHMACPSRPLPLLCTIRSTDLPAFNKTSALLYDNTFALIDSLAIQTGLNSWAS